MSIDAFRERQVPRSDVFGLLRWALGAGVAVGLHLVGSGPDDTYLADLVAETRRVFADRVPMLVNAIRAVGRAAAWTTARPVVPDPSASCPAPWRPGRSSHPTGTVLACCNQATVDRRPAPEHLTPLCAGVLLLRPGWRLPPALRVAVGLERTMGSMFVVVGRVLGQDVRQVPFTGDEGPVGALSADVPA